MRRQLRTGAPGLTVKASAIAHGFWHQSEFSIAYRSAFGELPSATRSSRRVAGIDGAEISLAITGDRAANRLRANCIAMRAVP